MAHYTAYYFSTSKSNIVNLFKLIGWTKFDNWSNFILYIALEKIFLLSSDNSGQYLYDISEV